MVERVATRTLENAATVEAAIGQDGSAASQVISERFETPMTAGLFDAAPCEGVQIGTCVMLVDDKIVYAGPLKKAPKADGVTILLHADDFELLRSRVEKHRH